MRVVPFNLKQGVDPAACETWARGTDVPGVNALTAAHGFTVHKATGMFGSDATPPYQYVETIDIVAMEPFVAAFGEFADDPQFIMTEDL